MGDRCIISMHGRTVKFQPSSDFTLRSLPTPPGKPGEQYELTARTVPVGGIAVYCDSCGSELRDQQGFCHSCGKSFAPVTTPRTPGRVAHNIRLLGILWIVYSVIHLVPGLFVAAILPVGMPWARGVAFGSVPGFVPGTFLGIMGGFLLIVSLLGIVAGWGLLERKPWARTLAIVFGCLALLNIPIGTALGIFTLYVLASSDAERQYREAA